jgi:hypothetical protein
MPRPPAPLGQDRRPLPQPRLTASRRPAIVRDMVLTTLHRVPVTARAFDPVTGRQLTLTAPSWTSQTTTSVAIEDATLAPNGSSAMAWLVGKTPGASVVTFQAEAIRPELPNLPITRADTVVVASGATIRVDLLIGGPEPQAPAATTLVPATAALGSPNFTLRVQGQRFAPGALVFWNGVPEYDTVWVTEGEVQAGITLAGQVAGPVPVRVRNSDGQETGDLTFTLTAA